MSRLVFTLLSVVVYDGDDGGLMGRRRRCGGCSDGGGVAHGVDGVVGEEEHEGDHEGRGAGENPLEEPDEGRVDLLLDLDQNPLEILVE